VHPRVTGWASAAAAMALVAGVAGIVGIGGGGCTAKAKHPDHAVLPAWAQDEFHRLELDERLELHQKVEPGFQLGDFDGDGQLDVAAQVQDRRSGKVGVLLLHRAGGGHVLGAGQPLGDGGDDWNWLAGWKVVAGEQVPGGAANGKNALFVEKRGSPGGVIYWNGSDYVWVPWSG